MFWKLFDLLGFIFDVMDVFSSDFGLGSRLSSDRKILNYDEKPQKESGRSKYFTEKISAALIAVSAFLFSDGF
jgi:hypothetical protein